MGTGGKQYIYKVGSRKEKGVRIDREMRGRGRSSFGASTLSRLSPRLFLLEVV
jgi:hypothetical protein